MSPARIALILFMNLLPPVMLPANDAGRKEGVTFNKHVARIFYDRCVTCHRPNDVAPMSLMTYKEARPWAAGRSRGCRAAANAALAC